MKKIFLFFGGALFVFFAARDGLEYYRAYKNQDALPTPTPTPSPTALAVRGTPEPIGNGNISVSAPGRNAGVTLPFSVSGMARVFKNTVTIAVKDEDGSELYRDFTDARSPDTGQLGPFTPLEVEREQRSRLLTGFTKTITYLQKPPTSPNLILEVFWNSPEDGRPLDVISIPLIFNASGARAVKVFFGNAGMDLSAGCAVVYPAMRLIASMQAPVAGAIEQLLKGPTPEELRSGYVTVIPGNIEMPRIAVAQGTATVDFVKDILAQDTGEGMCRIPLMKAQIERTLYQFPNISGAVISVEGNKDIFTQ